MNRILSLIGVVLMVGCGPEPRDMETLHEVDGVLKSAVDGHLQPYSGPVFRMTGDVRTLTSSLKDGEYDGPYENYNRDGQLGLKGTFKDFEKCGEWLEEGETVTYDPC